MKTSYIINSESISAFVGNKVLFASAGSVRYSKAKEALRNGDDEKFQEALQESEEEVVMEEIQGKGFILEDGQISLDGIPITGPLKLKLDKMIAQEIDIAHLSSFVRNLRKNPSMTSINELYDFLSYAELPITEDGYFLCYKGVNNDYWSVHAGATTLSKGTVDHSGRIFNGIGEKIKCSRNQVDDDREIGCSHGLHVGSMNYATDWGSRVVVVKVNPKNVVSVPKDCSFQKLRCSAYEVLMDYETEIKDTVVDSEGNGGTDPDLVYSISRFIRGWSKHSDVISVGDIVREFPCLSSSEVRRIVTSELGWWVNPLSDYINI